MELKTYGSRLVDFLKTSNVILVESRDDLNTLAKKLAKIGLKLSLNWDQMVKHCVSNKVAIEYDNNRGFTFYPSLEEAVDWYGEEPIKLSELEI